MTSSTFPEEIYAVYCIRLGRRVAEMPRIDEWMQTLSEDVNAKRIAASLVHNQWLIWLSTRIYDAPIISKLGRCTLVGAIIIRTCFYWLPLQMHTNAPFNTSGMVW